MEAASSRVRNFDELASVGTDGLWSCGTGSRGLDNLAIDAYGCGAVVHLPGLSILGEEGSSYSNTHALVCGKQM